MERRTRLLLIEHEPDLSELNELILTDAGYLLSVAPPNADPVAIVEHVRPDVIVVGIRPTVSQDWNTIDLLQANPDIRKIPVVVISTSEQVAAAAQAAPIVSQHTVVAPYDPSTLEAAVARALERPPPAAVLPPAGPQSRAVAFATESLNKQSRQIALRAIGELQQVEPYRSRFRELTRGLVDDLGVMIGAIFDGIHAGLPASEVFGIPPIRRAIDDHVRLRIEQGLGPAAAIREYQTLQLTIDRFLRELVGQNGFTALDAFDMSQRIRLYIDELVRIVVESYAPPDVLA